MKRAILVKSCDRFQARQKRSMRSWMAELINHVPARFIVGGFSREFWTTFTIGSTADDSYAGNAQKLRDGIKWMLRLEDFESLFICDDDTFIDVDRWLAHEPDGECEGRLYFAKNDEDVRRNDGRPWINGGAGWWMSRRLCELYVLDVRNRTSADDIEASKVAQRHGVKIIDRPDLYGDSRYCCSPEISATNSLITSHPSHPPAAIHV